jgi:hypothetical protein
MRCSACPWPTAEQRTRASDGALTYPLTVFRQQLNAAHAASTAIMQPSEICCGPSSPLKYRNRPTTTSHTCPACRSVAWMRMYSLRARMHLHVNRSACHKKNDSDVCGQPRHMISQPPNVCSSSDHARQMLPPTYYTADGSKRGGFPKSMRCKQHCTGTGCTKVLTCNVPHTTLHDMWVGNNQWRVSNKSFSHPVAHPPV